jgi:pimeloyl-[acyl-carrier protein] methyl ester esterase
MTDGSFQSIVLLPGLDGTGTLFADLIAELPPNWEIVVARYATDEFLTYEQLLEQVRSILPPRPFILLAESFSTPLAVRIAAALPAEVVGAVLAAGFVTNPLGHRAPIARALARPASFRIAPLMWVMKKFLIGERPPIGLAKRLRDAIRSVSPEVLARRVRAVLDCDESASLARTRVPLLYLEGKRDRLVVPRCFEEIRRIRPDAQLEIIDAPHLVLRVQPRFAAERIVRFANGWRA